METRRDRQLCARGNESLELAARKIERRREEIPRKMEWKIESWVLCD